MVRKSTRLPQSSQSIQDSKSVEPHGSVGSNPTRSAKMFLNQVIMRFKNIFSSIQKNPRIISTFILCFCKNALVKHYLIQPN